MTGYEIETGSPVWAFGQMNISGNVTPHAWYQTVVRTTKSGKTKPDLNAITILADVVYWYRPIEVREETTGRLIGYRKRFKADKLQRDYKAFSELYGLTKNQVRSACRTLEELGVVDLDFRQVGDANNVLFIGLDPDRLRELTHPAPLPQKNQGDSPKKIRETPLKNSGTYTETTTETTTEVKTSSVEGALAPSTPPKKKTKKGSTEEDLADRFEAGMWQYDLAVKVAARLKYFDMLPRRYSRMSEAEKVKKIKRWALTLDRIDRIDGIPPDEQEDMFLNYILVPGSFYVENPNSFGAIHEGMRHAKGSEELSKLDKMYRKYEALSKRGKASLDRLGVRDGEVVSEERRDALVKARPDLAPAFHQTVFDERNRPQYVYRPPRVHQLKAA